MTIHVKITLYIWFILPFKQDDLGLLVGEYKPIFLPPSDSTVNGWLGQFKKCMWADSCYEEHPIICVTRWVNARYTFQPVQETVEYNIPNQG